MSTIFAFRDSGLSAFLFSDVGMEANGSNLTILSLLARLGKDPWAKAGAWAIKPRDEAIELLAKCISEMAPNQQAHDDAHLTASRLPVAEAEHVGGFGHIDAGPGSHAEGSLAGPLLFLAPGRLELLANGRAKVRSSCHASGTSGDLVHEVIAGINSGHDPAMGDPGHRCGGVHAVVRF